MDSIWCPPIKLGFSRTVIEPGLDTTLCKLNPAYILSLDKLWVSIKHDCPFENMSAEGCKCLPRNLGLLIPLARVLEPSTHKHKDCYGCDPYRVSG